MHLNPKSTNEALDDTFEKIGFMNEEPHKDIKVEKAADLPNEEFHYKDEERFDLKDLIKNSKGKILFHSNLLLMVMKLLYLKLEQLENH